MKANLILFSLIFSFIVLETGCFSQKGLKPKDESVAIIDLEVDKLGDYYTVDNSGNIKKYSSDNSLLYSYSNTNLGNLSMIDVSNPHKILVFYTEQQIIVLLDNSLSEIGSIELNNNYFFTSAGMANDGNIWLFDLNVLKLMKINIKGEIIEESFTINSMESKRNLNTKIIDRNNYVMLFDSEEVLLFNNLGYFDKVLPLKDIIKPTILNDKIYYFNRQSKNYMSYDIRFREITTIFEFKEVKQNPLIAIYENNTFYLLINNKIVKIDKKY